MKKKFLLQSLLSIIALEQLPSYDTICYCNTAPPVTAAAAQACSANVQLNDDNGSFKMFLRQIVIKQSRISSVPV